MDYLLFVYGTLRKGEKNHYLIRKAECIEQNVYIYGSMYDTGAGYPAIRLDASQKVCGELYRIDDEMLRIVDRLEGYRPERNENLYERIHIQVFGEDREYEALVYVAGTSLNGLTDCIQSGDWVQYRKQHR